MDGENNGKPYYLMDDLGGKPTIFGNAHLFSLSPRILFIQTSRREKTPHEAKEPSQAKSLQDKWPIAASSFLTLKISKMVV